MFRGQYFDGVDRLDLVYDVMGVDFAMDLLMLDLMDFWQYRFLNYCWTYIISLGG